MSIKLEQRPCLVRVGIDCANKADKEKTLADASWLHNRKRFLLAVVELLQFCFSSSFFFFPSVNDGNSGEGTARRAERIQPLILSSLLIGRQTSYSSGKIPEWLQTTGIFSGDGAAAAAHEVSLDFFAANNRSRRRVELHSRKSERTCGDKTEADQGAAPDGEETGVFRFLVRFLWFVLDQIGVTTGFGAVKPKGCWFTSRPIPCSSSCVYVASLQVLARSQTYITFLSTPVATKVPMPPKKDL